MSLTVRQRKWLKRLAYFVITIGVLLFTLYHIITYRLNDVLRYAVSKETNGLYALNTSGIKFSFPNKTLTINEIVLRCTDTTGSKTYYNIDVPKVYLRITSWSDLIFKKKLEVDSLHIDLPSIKKYGLPQPKEKEKNISFHVSQILEGLEKMVQHLNIRKLHIGDASFAYHAHGSERPFVSDRLNLSVSNFSKSDQQQRLFSADDIDISQMDQHWVLPGSENEISFKRFHFSGASQLFELDSCVVIVPPRNGNGGMKFTADKLYFNSTQLASLYEKESLYIDTLVCVRPVLHLPGGKKDTATQNSVLSQTLHSLFKDIRFKYISVEDGQLVMNDKTMEKATYATHSVDVKIFNLGIVPGNASPLTTDSIQLNLENLVFYTADSMFQMNIDRFSLHNNEILFANATFHPSSRNPKSQSMSFTTSRLRLIDIDLESLMQKKLKAVTAELTEPVILLSAKHKEGGVKDPDAGIERFYNTLHGLHDLVAVQNFNIINGSLHYKSAGKAPVSIDMKKINTNILLDRFLRSDSLIDIKRSMPKLTIANIDVQAPNLRLGINNWKFEGLSRHNHIETLQLALGGHTTISGKKLYWEIFDWDKLQQEKVIQIETIKFQQLDIVVNKDQKQIKKQRKDLPFINIQRVDVDQLSYRMQSGIGSHLHFAAKDMCIDEISSRKQFLTWNNAMTNLSDVNFTGKNAETSIKDIAFDNQFGSVLRGITIAIKKDSGYTNVNAPVLKLNAPLHSTDFSHFAVNSLVVDSPQVEMLSHKGAKTQGKAMVMPVDMQVRQLVVNNAAVRHRAIQLNDTTDIAANVTVKAEAFHTYKNNEQLFQYDKAAINIAGLHFNKQKLAVALPQTAIVLAKGSAIKKQGTDSVVFATGAQMKWDGVSMAMDKPDSTMLRVKALSGSFENDRFVLQKGQKLEWQSLLPHTTISKGNISFSNKKITAKAGMIAWQPQQQSFHIRSFSMVPNLSIEETFGIATWQADYMKVAGEELTLSGISMKQTASDSLLHIKKIEAGQVAISTTRDKRIPFKHGTEKMMPTQLINTLRMPLVIDSILVSQSNVEVHEISAITNKEGMIPITHINASITNITNRPGSNDSLVVVANARVLNNNIRHFQYHESYNDSLSAFRVRVHISPMHLPVFSDVTTPLAAVKVEHGQSDTLFASWQGNKYAAVGTMDFYYKELKVRLLNKKDLAKKMFALSVINALANTFVLNRKNKKQSRIFYIRDREKFVFNYWIKTDLRGMMSSVGLKSNRKYMKEYRKWKKLYMLPEYEASTK